MVILEDKVKQHMELVSGQYLNATNLAEDAADSFNHPEWLDDETHWVWDLAIEVLCGDEDA